MTYLYIKQYTNNQKCNAVMTMKNSELINIMREIPIDEVEQYIIDVILPEAKTNYYKYDDEDYLNADYFTTEVWLKRYRRL